ncbi:MAG: glycerophosphodiester phosphodiesterase family protein [Gemmatimonadales bacterium]
MSNRILTDPTSRPIVAHRGASGLAPENTLASFELAAEQGAEAFELDLRLAGDGVPVVFHDATLDRTTDRTGPLRALSSSELSSVDAGHRFRAADGSSPYAGRGVSIPTLEAVLTRFPEMPLLIELKEVEVAEAARRVLERHRAETRAVVASFDERATALFDRATWKVAPGRRGITEHVFRAALGLEPKDSGLACFAVPVRYKDWLQVPTRRFVAAARRLGCPVHVWTVNRADLAERLWDLGASGMITNVPADLLAARRARFGA